MKLIETAITEAAHGDPLTLMGILDQLIFDDGIEITRIVDFAHKHYSFPKELALSFIMQLLVH